MALHREFLNYNRHFEGWTAILSECLKIAFWRVYRPEAVSRKLRRRGS
jgi:hypothetical protein